MITSRNQKVEKRIEIDLTGPDGNAYALMGYAKNIGQHLGFSQDQITGIMAEMMSGDYENLLSVMEKYFGEYIIIYR
jgi:hypothetical protein